MVQTDADEDHPGSRRRSERRRICHIACPGGDICRNGEPGGVARMVREPYEESADFSAAVGNMTQDVLAQFRIRDIMETDGAYNPDKIIDVLEYHRPERISGVNASGIRLYAGPAGGLGQGLLYLATVRRSTAIMKWWCAGVRTGATIIIIWMIS